MDSIKTTDATVAWEGTSDSVSDERGAGGFYPSTVEAMGTGMGSLFMAKRRQKPLNQTGWPMNGGRDVRKRMGHSCNVRRR